MDRAELSAIQRLLAASGEIRPEAARGMSIVFHRKEKIMERRLKFYVGRHDGVRAIADEESYFALIGGKRLIEAASPEVSNWKVFTFVRPERYRRDNWFFGTHEMLERLIKKLKASGAEIIDVGGGMFIPFSSGYLPHPPECRFFRGRFDSPEIFGIRLEEFREKVGE